MLSTKLKEAAGNSADATLYVDDVFSTYLYNGLNATQTITTGIDLATKGGLLWLKGRNVGSAYGYGDHELFDSANVGSTSKYLRSDGTDSISAGGSIAATPFTTTGFNLKAGPQVNNRAGDTTVAWTFRKAAKFFDVVTYTGNGGVQNIAHSLGVAPGMIIVKNLTSSIYNWAVYHRSLGNNSSLKLNTTDAAVSPISWWDTTDPTSTHFTVGPNSNVNGSAQYVAYLFAHDTSSTGIIQCGSFTSTGTAVGADINVNLGWETQYVLVKANNASNWQIYDTMRGFSVTGTRVLYPNLSDAEVDGGSAFSIEPTATGFTAKRGLGWAAGTQVLYMAIRMPNKPPTTGTQVYSPAIYSGDGTSNRLISTYGFAPDLIIGMARNQIQRKFFWDRLRGASVAVDSTTTDAEYSTGTAISLSTNMLGVSVTDNGASYTNTTGYNYDDIGFKRAPGFFDEVCYTGTGVATTQAHNLGVVPELMIVKDRSSAYNWYVGATQLSYSSDQYLSLNLANAVANGGGSYWNNTAPTSSVFSLGNNSVVNGSPDKFVAYLFATLAGISKVGSYTGNGTGQAIACGFGAAGARFVLIKRVNGSGDWYTFDSVRGLTSGSSPYLLLNSTAAETTGNNGVYASTGGFTLGATAITTTNILGASYIYLSVA